MDLQNSGMESGNATELEKDAFGRVNSWPNGNRKEENFIGVEKGESSPFAPEGSIAFGESIVGLKLGMPENSDKLSSTTNSSLSSGTGKRSRISYPSLQNSRCQVEGCNLDLSSAKDYHRRHRICESHSKSPRVIVAGVERRFCQQCSRFHNLSEFDDKKRSCRRRLSDHNARRRRPQPDAMRLSSMGLSPSVYERRPPSFLLNRMPSSSSSSRTWECSASLKMEIARNSLIRASGVDASPAYAQSHELNEPQNMPHALSLLSTTSWSLHEQGSASLEQLMQGNTVTIPQPALQLDSQNWISTVQQVSAEQAPSAVPLPLHSMALQTTDSSHLQDYRFYRPPYEPAGFHFSSRIN